MRKLLMLFLSVFSLNVFSQLGKFNAGAQPAAPDYSKEENWSALPFRKDAADVIPKTETWVNDSLKGADVFYIYPTLYLKGKTWNADLKNKKLNKRLDNKPVRYQASVFNATCRVYAPRYRQSIIDVFDDLEGEGKKSLAFAYEDVKNAFQYYLDHYNNGRPFIIASHSQGTYHARRLLEEMIDGTELQNRMVAAYAIGFAIDTMQYKKLKPCESETETNCYITWASFKKGYEPKSTDLAGNVCVNPLSWNRQTIEVDKSKSMGAILLNFNHKYLNNVSAQIHSGYLWVGSKLPLVSSWNNLHIADYNLFWYDIRANVKKRVEAFERTVTK